MTPALAEGKILHCIFSREVWLLLRALRELRLKKARKQLVSVSPLILNPQLQKDHSCLSTRNIKNNPGMAKAVSEIWSDVSERTLKY